MWPGPNYSPHPVRQSASPEPAWKPGTLGASCGEQRVLLAPGPCTAVGSWHEAASCITRGNRDKMGGC